MKVALIFTVWNERQSLPRLIAGVDAQTRQPDQVVVVDGGSTDGTWEQLVAWAEHRPGTEVISAPGANIGRGRNLAIHRAEADVVAVTDAGAHPRREWLAALVSPFSDPTVDMAMGFYRGRPTSAFERIVDCLNLPDAEEVDPDRFMPSSRSVAFRKALWQRVGGYPEWLDVGEDMWFDLRVVALGGRRLFVPEAIVEWELRPGLRPFLRQYYRYARGDGQARMHDHRHAIRFAAYALGIAAAAVARYRPAALLVPAVAGAVWLRPAYRRAWRRLGSERAAALFALPLLNTAMDAAKMAGYIAGRARRDPALLMHRQRDDGRGGVSPTRRRWSSAWARSPARRPRRRGLLRPAPSSGLRPRSGAAR